MSLALRFLHPLLPSPQTSRPQPFPKHAQVSSGKKPAQTPNWPRSAGDISPSPLPARSTQKHPRTKRKIMLSAHRGTPPSLFLHPPRLKYAKYFSEKTNPRQPGPTRANPQSALSSPSPAQVMQNASRKNQHPPTWAHPRSALSSERLTFQLSSLSSQLLLSAHQLRAFDSQLLAIFLQL